MIEPFDWQRIFFGDTSWLFLLEVIFRTSLLYLFAILLLRLTGSRGVGQLSAFDVVIIIAMGSAVGDPMFYPNVPLLHGFVVITVIVLIQRLISLLLINRTKAEGILEGKPLTIVDEGRLLLENLDRATLSQEDVFMQLRHQSISNLGAVRKAYVEHDGQFSIFQFRNGRERSGLPLIPPRDVLEPEAFKTGMKPEVAGDFACLQCGEVTYAGLATSLPVCPRCQYEEWVKAKENTAD